MIEAIAKPHDSGKSMILNQVEKADTPVLHASNIPSSSFVHQTTTSSITSLGKIQKCWIIRLILKIPAAIIECFKGLFFIPKSPTPLPPSESGNNQPPLQPSQVPQIISTAPDEEKKDHGYAAFEPTNVEKEKIQFIFHWLAKSEKLWEVKSKGGEIHHIHPYKLLKELLTRKLKPDLQKIRQSTPLWYLFIKNLSQSFNRYSNEHLSLYLPDFAHEIGCDPSVLAPFLRTRNWKGLVLKLLQFQNVES